MIFATAQVTKRNFQSPFINILTMINVYNAYRENIIMYYINQPVIANTKSPARPAY